MGVHAHPRSGCCKESPMAHSRHSAPTDPPHQADLEARLARLEGGLELGHGGRRRSFAAAGVAIACACAFLAGAAAGPGAVQHRSLDIVGPNGQIAASLRSHGDGGGILILHGPAGEAQLILSAQRGGHLLLRGRAGDDLLTLGELAGFDRGGASDQGAMVLRNSAGEVAVQITSDQLGRGYVGVFDPRGVGRTLQPRPSDGLGSRWQPAP